MKNVEGQDELVGWLALARAPGIGSATLRRLVTHFGSAQAALRARRSQLQALDLAPETVQGIVAASPDDAAQDLAWLAGPAHHLLTLDDPRYPARLRETPGAPAMLFVNGDPAYLSTPQLAIVGSRHPTPAGREMAFEFARHLAATGLTITSGMALGIDTAAHEGALAGGGPTIAVAGTGLDRVYPARNRTLAHRIVTQGAIVSEFPIGTPPKPEHFPQRNRILSGLALGTLVVEAARQSGSLITARLAAEQGREVFAVPGSIHNPLARGCHWLIRQGAKLVETAEDIVEELRGVIDLCEPTLAGNGAVAHDNDGAAFASDPAYARLLEALGFEPTSVDTLVERTGLTPEAVSSMLLILELHERVASMSGGMYLRLRPREEDERKCT